MDNTSPGFRLVRGPQLLVQANRWEVTTFLQEAIEPWNVRKHSERPTEHLHWDNNQFYHDASYLPASRALMSFRLKPQWRQENSSLGRHLPVQKAFSLEGSSRALPSLWWTNMILCQKKSQQHMRCGCSSRRQQGRLGACAIEPSGGNI